MIRKLLATLIAPLAAALVALAPPAAAQFPMLMSPEQEKQVGADEHPKILARFGGVYDDPEIGAYVASIGGRLVAHSDTPQGEFRFTVLNSPVVNAFALPGGYVYVTRGLIALANNEAELAGVIAHEIGHVTARHSAQRYSRSVLFGLGAFALGALFGSDIVGQIAQVGSELYLQGYSRDQEFEADTLGVRYLGRTGYAPQAQAAFLQSLNDYSALMNTIAGKAGAEREFDLFATHPRTADRVQRAIQEAGTQPQSPIWRRDDFLDRVNGMLYGDDPAQGFIRGRTFSHPALRFTFTVPEGFRLINTDKAVMAPGPNGAMIQFDHETDARKVQAARDPADYLVRIWAPKLGLRNVEAITVNGMPAATGWNQIQGQNGPVDVRLVAIRFDARTFYRFLFVTPPNLTRQLDAGLQRTTYGFRALSPQEAAALKPLKLAVLPVRAGDTVERLAARMPDHQDHKLEQFRVLNGLRQGDTVTPGQRVKLVVE